MAISIFDAPVAEYKTRKAALKFAARCVQKTKVVKCYVSAFDTFNVGPVYQVVLIAESPAFSDLPSTNWRGI